MTCCLSKIVRHSYNAYLGLNLKFEYYWIDWLRMNSFYLLYTTEYALSILLLFAAIPNIKRESAQFIQMPNEINFDLDVTLIYFVLLFASVPNFISTFVYLHRKRK